MAESNFDHGPTSNWTRPFSETAPVLSERPFRPAVLSADVHALLRDDRQPSPEESGVVFMRDDTAIVVAAATGFLAFLLGFGGGLIAGALL